MTAPTETDLAWAAGLFDGEGTVGIYPSGKSGHRLAVEIGNSHLVTLERFVELFGGRIYRIRSKRPQRQMYQWSITERTKGTDFLYAIHPYSVTKRRQIWLAAEWVALRPRRRPNRYRPLTPEERQIDQTFGFLLREAKKAEIE